MRHDKSDRDQAGRGHGSRDHAGCAPGHIRTRRQHHPEQGPAEGRRSGRGAYRGLRGGHGRARAQRGDVRGAVLLLLADAPMHGYQLIQAIIERTGGAWKPSPGAIYPTIAQLEDEGLVSIIAEGGRKVVTMTDAGRTYLEDNQAAIGDPFAEMHDRGNGDLRNELGQLYAAMRTVGQTGSREQVYAAEQVLADARRALFLILADAPGRPTEANTPTGNPEAE
ncbi:MAG: PadR family transcriptional regulator [Actinomycetota bacterium]|nr:PadR family transcriptional regulator [Actinomycetota bacterium]